MAVSVNQLERVLAEELEVFDELARSCTEAKDKILSCDIAGLAEVTRRQNELIMAAAATCKGRTAMLGELSDAESDDGASARSVSEPYASRVAEHAARLRPIVDEVRRRSERNRHLLASSLTLVDRAVRFLCGTDETGITYTRPASAEADLPRPSNVLLNKEV